MMDAILPLVGVLIGATLSPWLAHSLARRKEAASHKREAYLGFVRAISNLANRDATPELSSGLREANYQIIIHGDGSVVEEVQKLMDYDNLSDREAQAQFVSVILAMRRDVGSRSFDGETGSIRKIVFGD